MFKTSQISYFDLGLKNSLWIWQQGVRNLFDSWLRHQMETISALLAIFAGISPVTGDFPA